MRFGRSNRRATEEPTTRSSARSDWLREPSSDGVAKRAPRGGVRLDRLIEIIRRIEGGAGQS